MATEFISAPGIAQAELADFAQLSSLATVYEILQYSRALACGREGDSPFFAQLMREGCKAIICGTSG